MDGDLRGVGEGQFMNTPYRSECRDRRSVLFELGQRIGQWLDPGGRSNYACTRIDPVLCVDTN
jgi:hypothetical protein